jgi:D-3-phosphoglycerate dehydrogenase
MEVVEQIVDVLEGRPAPFAVNAPAISAESARVLAPFSGLAQTLGNLATQLTEGQLRGVEIIYSGEIAEHDTAALKASVIRGLLQTVSDEPVTLVNAAIVARNRGLRIIELKSSAPENYTNLITVQLHTETGDSIVGGTLLNDMPHIVRIDEYWVSVASTGGHVLLTRHTDRPGIVRDVSTILAAGNINISQMQLGREVQRGPALMLLFVDEPIPPETLNQIKTMSDLQYAKLVRI